MSLSIVILTYNEERRLRDCLASIGCCDEVVVIDGYSTDSTVSIAHEFTEKVFLSDLLGPKNPGGFAAQRNFALEKVTGKWVFFLDADERFTPELSAELREFCDTDTQESIAACRVRRKEHFFGVYTPYTHGEAWQTRLLRKDRAIWDDRLVHEGLRVNGQVGSLDGFLLHFSKDSLADYLVAQNRYTSLEAEQAVLERQPLAKSPWSAMIKTFLNVYVYKGSYREGAFGLIMSLLFAQYSFLCWAKRWEIELKAGRLCSRDPRPPMSWIICVISRVWTFVSPGRRD